MIKKIDVSKVKVGMYVHDLDCGWMQHPFVRSQFKITKASQIAEIEKAGIKAIHIDVAKGIDVGEIPVIENAKIDNELEMLLVDATVETTQETPLLDELPHAIKIRGEATNIVSTVVDNAKLGKLIELNHIEPVVENLVMSTLRNKDALLGFMRIRDLDKYTLEHSIGSAVLLVAFGASISLKEDELIQLGIAGLLMDIGKSVIPAKILVKPDKLLPPEITVMRQHVDYSQRILKKIPNISDIALSVAIEHHERCDGSGYPQGKVDDDISLYGKMAAIVDAYDALTSDRVYCQGISPSKALKKLLTCGNKFNQQLVQQFIHCVGIYPVGSLVALSNGLIAVVVETGTKGLLYPVVRVVFDSEKKQFISQHVINLSDLNRKENIKIVEAVETGKWNINPADFMDYVGFN